MWGDLPSVPDFIFSTRYCSLLLVLPKGVELGEATVGDVKHESALALVFVDLDILLFLLLLFFLFAVFFLFLLKISKQIIRGEVTGVINKMSCGKAQIESSRV
jgi:hypothetical protein